MKPWRPSRGDAERLPKAAVRPARPDDVNALVAIERRCFRSYYRPHRLRAMDFTRYFHRDNTVAVVAVAGARVIGYALGSAPVSGHPSVARIDSVAVLASWRRRNLGYRLLRRFLHRARRAGCRAASLEVAVANRRAQALFYKAGFERHRTLPDYYGRAADAIRLRAILARRRTSSARVGRDRRRAARRRA